MWCEQRMGCTAVSTLPGNACQQRGKGRAATGVEPGLLFGLMHRLGCLALSFVKIALTQLRQ